MAGINFRSSSVIDLERENLKNARKHVIEKARHQYEKAEKRQKEAEARGETTWMLDSLSNRIQADEKAAEKAKNKQKKEKRKQKKEKKKKKKRKKHESSESSSDSDSDVDGEQWIEKSTTDPASTVSSDQPIKGPMLQRDSWMEEAFDVHSTSRKELRDKLNREKEEKKAEAQKQAETERLKLELNPYWKDGGTGMPEEEKSSKSKSKDLSGGFGDGGLSWLKKSFQRCKEQAVEEGRSVEELAAERWGSLKKIEKMIAEAERKQQELRRPSSPPRWKRRNRSRSRSPHRRRTRSRSPDSNQRNRSRSPHHKNRKWSRSPEHKGSSRYSENSSRSERSNKSFLKPEDERSTSGSDHRSDRDKERSARMFLKPDDSKYSVSKSRSDRSTSGSDHRSDRDKERSARTFLKPGDSKYSVSESRSDRSRSFLRPDTEPESRTSRESGSRDSRSRQFLRPDERKETDRQKYSSRSDDQSEAPRWQKKGFVSHNRNRDDSKKHQSEPSSKSQRRQRSVTPSESSSSSSSDSEEVEEEEEESDEGETTPTITILTEQEMNQLGAKILRAEMMGDDNLAEELKAKLDAARKAKEENPNLIAAERSEKKSEEVVLTRTNRGGLVQPLPDAQHSTEHGGKKRRKKKNVATHSGAGERDRYFDDDDQHSLKSLVAREKMGTAEDQNSMFARLAGRATDKTDEDFQVDDIFISKAARQQSEAQNEERDKAKAILEHRKLTSAMDKCKFCFDKVPKHLIIAIGVKVYLCLPNHRSLTPGHCLIVPMQHVTSGTSIDEDVWQEIQTFRKCLVRLFESREEDPVFMETSMHLKHLPHMAVECIPMEKEIGDLAPIYFKKAIQEAGPEWAQNKRLVDLSRKDVRHSVPKGFPYFSVDFGLQGGFAHVIEEEHTFPSYFGREIVGGMIDAEPGLWRKPHKESFDVQRKKVLEFAEWWKPFDWTQDLQGKQ